VFRAGYSSGKKKKQKKNHQKKPPPPKKEKDEGIRSSARLICGKEGRGFKEGREEIFFYISTKKKKERVCFVRSVPIRIKGKVRGSPGRRRTPSAGLVRKKRKKGFHISKERGGKGGETASKRGGTGSCRFLASPR